VVKKTNRPGFPSLLLCLVVQTRFLRARGTSRWREARRYASLAVLFLLATNGSWAVVERLVEKRISVTAGRTSLTIDAYHGPISVVATAEPEIYVAVRQTMEVNSEAEADLRLHELELVVLEKETGGLAIQARYRKAVQWSWKTWPPVSLAFEVRVPRACDLDLLTRDGAITVGDLQGAVKVRTLKGSIFLREIEGSVEAASEQGDVAVTACSQSLTIAAKDGNVLVGRTNGPTEVSDTNGLLEIQNARGPLRASGDGADLKIGFAYPLSAPAELVAAGGDIAVSFDTRNAFAIDAKASRFGYVRVRDLPLAITSGKVGASHLSGQLKGGGPKVSIRASGGNIRLTGFAPMP